MPGNLASGYPPWCVQPLHELNVVESWQHFVLNTVKLYPAIDSLTWYLYFSVMFGKLNQQFAKDCPSQYKIWPKIGSLEHEE